MLDVCLTASDCTASTPHTTHYFVITLLTFQLSLAMNILESSVMGVAIGFLKNPLKITQPVVLGGGVIGYWVLRLFKLNIYSAD